MESMSVSELLRLHRGAYEVLRRLDRRALDDPSVLSAEVVAQLRRRKGCAAWLREHWAELPAECLPELGQTEAFAHLLSSFFDVSFQVESLTMDGRLLDARLTHRMREHQRVRRLSPGFMGTALRHVLAAEGVRLSKAEARALAAREVLRLDVYVCVYIWTLRQRAKGKSRDESSYLLWRNLPREVRLNLDEETCRKAGQRVVEAARALPAGDDMRVTNADATTMEGGPRR